MISRSRQSYALPIFAAITLVCRGNEAWIRKHEPRLNVTLAVVWLYNQDAESFTGNLTYTSALIVAG